MIELRDVKPEDREMIRQWRNLPDVNKYMFTDHHITAAEHESWFQNVLKQRNCRYWVIVSDNEDVGLVGIYALDSRNRRCHWGRYIASPDQRGKGIGTYVEYWVLRYVFDELKLNKLCTEVLSFNETVLNMHNQFGFQQEGYFRKHIFKSGAFHDVVAMAILQSDWEARKLEFEVQLREKGLL